jgi:hypothetical protein
LELAFTDISFDQPAASTFNFTPPPGATVTESPSPLGFLGFLPGNREGRPHRRSDGTAPAASTPPPTESAASPNSLSPNALPNGTTVVGDAWDAVVISRSVPLGGPVGAFLRDAQTIATPAGTGRLITTSLVNVIVLDDGRVAVGAVTPEAVANAIPAS